MDSDKQLRVQPKPIRIEGESTRDDVPWANPESESKSALSVSGIFIFTTFFVLVAFFASPFYSLHALGKALLSGNSEIIERMIDLPAIKDQLLNEAVGKIGSGGSEDLNQVRIALDSLLSGQGVAEIFSKQLGERPVLSAIGKSFGTFPDAGVVRVRYRNLDTVEAEMDDGLVLFLERRGIVWWKVFRVELPDS